MFRTRKPLRPLRGRVAVAIANAAVVAVAPLAVALTTATPATATPAAAAVARPILFVHGAAGSAAQFETQAKRFASNGYPATSIDGIDYDYTFSAEPTTAVLNRIEQRVDALLQQTGADKVELVAHSLGTYLSHSYLETPARAAKVAHYVNLDGATALRLPGGVPTLAIWGEGSTLRRIGGATNVYQRDQSHTQTVTSTQSFTQMYRFFTGAAPQTTSVTPQTGAVQLSGRAVLFPSNVGAGGMGLTVYAIDATGRRTGQPVATFVLGADGSFGPFTADPSARYEFALDQGSGQTQHHYHQPFQRTDRLIRLLTNRPGEGMGARVPVGPAHSALSITRYKEWWGDQGSTSDDRLVINGTNIVNFITAPRDKRAIGVFAHDQNIDQRTEVFTSIDDFDETFITAADIYVPASANGAGTITIAVASRAGGGNHLFTVPNWPSSTDRITINVPDL